MPEYPLHYPAFNVLDEAKKWDAHTRSIVEQRRNTSSFYPLKFFSKQEARALFQLCSVLLDDRREPVIAFVIHHLDSVLKSGVGESQRKIGVPPQSDLIRKGLVLLDQACVRLYGDALEELNEENRQEAVRQFMQGSLPWPSGGESVPINDLVQKIVTEAVSAYYSHPAIWSEIGYAGPAYPRGYVRTELGLTDPWEAQKDDE